MPAQRRRRLRRGFPAADEISVSFQKICLSLFSYLHITSVHFFFPRLFLARTLFFFFFLFPAAQAPCLALHNEHINLCLTHFIPETSDLYQTLHKKDVVIRFIKTIVSAVSGGSVVFPLYIR